MNEKAVLTKEKDGLFWLILNRPETYNALDLNELTPLLLNYLEEANNNSKVRVVLIRGTGKAFCAGANVKHMFQKVQEENENETATKIFIQKLTGVFHLCILAIRRMTKPVIGVINGVASGGGLGLALACDIVIAAESAKFDPGYIRIGLTPDGGLTAHLLRQLGYQRTFEMLNVPQVLSAQKALDLGLINHIVPDDKLDEEAKKWALKLSSQPPHVLAWNKKLLNMAIDLPIETIMEEERLYINQSAEKKEFKERLLQFFQKKK